MKAAGSGLTVLAVNVGEARDAVGVYTEELGLRFPVGLDANQSLSGRYRVYGMPTTFFINREGVIDYVAIGARPSTELETRITTLVDANRLQ